MVVLADSLGGLPASSIRTMLGDFIEALWASRTPNVYNVKTR